MSSLPTLTPAEIEAELKGTAYDTGIYDENTDRFINDMELNAARAIRLAREVDEANLAFLAAAGQNFELERENEELRAKLQAQHQATWAMAIEAAAESIHKVWSKTPNERTDCALTSFRQNQIGAGMCEAMRAVKTLPCPPLETKGE